MKKSSLAGKRIIVGVSGSIAAYKAAEVVSQLALLLGLTCLGLGWMARPARRAP